MNKKSSNKDTTVIMSDRFLSESGVQGGKVVGEHIVIGAFIIGIPFFVIGLIGLYMLKSFIPMNTANIILVILLTVIGLILIIGGYFIYRDKHTKK